MNIEEYIRKLSRQIETLPTIIGNEVVNASKEAFKNQSWNGQAWTPRKPSADRNKNRAILVDSGRLRRSIRITKKGSNFVVVGSNVEYASIHNQGGTIQGRVTVKAHTRKPRNKRAHQVGSHSRQVNTTIPQRQFLGRSTELDARVQRAIRNHLKKAST